MPRSTSIPNADIADVINTVLKIAQKRAYIAATLSATNASEYFTQDLEDFVDVTAEAERIDTGGHPVGTKEAAKAVLDRKLAEPEPNQFNRAEDIRHDVAWEDLETGIQANPAASIPPPDAVVDLWIELNNRQGFDRLKLFEELKKSYGEEIYYRVLKANGCEHANKIPGRTLVERTTMAKKIIWEMYAANQESKQEVIHKVT